MAAAMAMQQGSFQRRQDEWNFNAQLATLDLATIDAQTTTAQAHVSMLQADVVAHQTSITQETEINQYLKNKYTNEELYEWMVGKVSSVYSNAYNLAFDLAKRAEQCLLFELPDTSGDTFIPYSGYWDSLKSGLLAANSLQYAIKSMEATYLQRNIREYELTKNVSL